MAEITTSQANQRATGVGRLGTRNDDGAEADKRASARGAPNSRKREQCRRCRKTYTDRGIGEQQQARFELQGGLALPASKPLDYPASKARGDGSGTRASTSEKASGKASERGAAKESTTDALTARGWPKGDMCPTRLPRGSRALRWRSCAVLRVP